MECVVMRKFMVAASAVVSIAALTSAANAADMAPADIYSAEKP